MQNVYNTLDFFVYPVVFAGLVPFLYEGTKNNRIDEWLGQLSYPFYLSHVFVLEAFQFWINPFKTYFLLIVCLSISAMLYLLELRFVEPWRSSLARSTR